MSNAINEFPVPIIFKKILKDEMSGELIVNHKDAVRNLFFINGRLEFATTTAENEHLGDVLLKTGKIDREQLRLALEIRSNVPTKIGEILAKTCDLAMGEIYEALTKQVKNIAVSLFPLKEGEWRFIKRKPKIPNPLNLKLKLSEVIREGLGKLDDISYYESRFKFRSPVTIELPEAVGRILSRDETIFYESLSQFSNISMKKVMARMQFPEPIFWRNIIMFYLLNLVDFVEFTVDDEEKNKKIEEINEVYDKIKSGQSDYFQLLDSDKITSPAEAKEKLHEYSDRFNPEKLNVAPDSTAMRRAREVFAEIQNAQTAARFDMEGRTGYDEEDVYAAGVNEESDPPLELGLSDKIQTPPGTVLDLGQVEPHQLDVDMDSDVPMELDANDKIQPPPGLDLEQENRMPPPLDVDMESEPPMELDEKEKIEPPPGPPVSKEIEIPAKIETPAAAETPVEEEQPTEEEQPAAPRLTKADLVKQAREFYTKANHLHNQKKYFEAASLLQKAIQIDKSRANYFLLLGLCQSKMLATKKMAENNLKKAAQMEPWNADPVFALGQLYKSENLMKKAKIYFEKALQINMDHTLAGQAMLNLGGRTGDKKQKRSLFGKKK